MLGLQAAGLVVPVFQVLQGSSRQKLMQLVVAPGVDCMLLLLRLLSRGHHLQQMLLLFGRPGMTVCCGAHMHTVMLKVAVVMMVMVSAALVVCGMNCRKHHVTQRFCTLKGWC